VQRVANSADFRDQALGFQIGEKAHPGETIGVGNGKEMALMSALVVRDYATTRTGHRRDLWT
jgi:hypothetical protein